MLPWYPLCHQLLAAACQVLREQHPKTTSPPVQPQQLTAFKLQEEHLLLSIMPASATSQAAGFSTASTPSPAAGSSFVVVDGGKADLVVSTVYLQQALTT